MAVPPDRDDEPVREFRSFTADLNAIADWLDACGVDTVAMESTGVYWIPLYELLEARGFKVLLVNARHVKNVSGRKSDVLDCQWLQQLMTYGLLSGAFRPADQVCVLRRAIAAGERDAHALAHPAPQRLGRAGDLGRDRLDRRPLRRVLVLGVEDHAHSTLDNLGGKLR